MHACICAGTSKAEVEEAMHDQPMQAAKCDQEDTVMEGAEQAASGIEEAMQGSPKNQQDQNEDQPVEAASGEDKQHADHSMLPAEDNPVTEEQVACHETADDQKMVPGGLIEATEPAFAPILQKEKVMQDHVPEEQDAGPTDMDVEQQRERATLDKEADPIPTTLHSKNVCDNETIPMEEEHAEDNELRSVEDANAPTIIQVNVDEQM